MFMKPAMLMAAMGLEEPPADQTRITDICLRLALPLYPPPIIIPMMKGS
jgi:hypothetical protein